MSYIGNTPKYSNYPSQLLSGTGVQTTFTMDFSIGSAASLLVIIDGVKQTASSYSVNGSQLIFSEAPPSGTDNIELIPLAQRGVVNTVADGAITEIKIASELLSRIKCTGEIFDFAGTEEPAYAFFCNGQEVSRTTEAGLFAIIGTTYGIGDGTTTFNVPNIPADYTTVQADGNVGTSTVGEVIAHIHSAQGVGGGGAYGSTQTGNNGATGSTGGPANLAAGVRVLKCIRK